jgi:hypothetical protein
LSDTHDFWVSCGHHLLDRGEGGGLVVTDEFLKAYLARPELAPPPDACAAERAMHRALLSDPCQPVTPAQVAAIADEDARENWTYLISWRDHVLSHATLEAAYVAIVRHDVKFPPIFLDQLVHVMLRNMLDDCDDPFMLRAAELFFRPQKLLLHEGSLLATDAETVSGWTTRSPPPLASMLGMHTPGIDVLSPSNADNYWKRSESFDMALDLTAGRRGLAALGDVVTLWVRTLLAVDVRIDPVVELRDVTLTWYVGLDSTATRIGDALWNGVELDQATQEQVVGLYRLTFSDGSEVIETAREAPTYLIVAGSSDGILRLKPQNLITGLPILRPKGAAN